MSTFDLVIRNGMVVDGSGGEPFRADVGVRDGIIVEIGECHGPAHEEIDAVGLLVTPGFVDIHTHYDGQVTWDDRTAPSANHGVTTVVMGNCGVGFAPCRPQDRQRLITLMEGVEDVPEVVMTSGLPWNWESFPEYLDAVEARARDVDVAAQLPHSCLRVYVMGERASAMEAATAQDRQRMAEVAEEAVRAGAIGFATSRSIFHRDKDGVPIPTQRAAEAELLAIAEGMKRAGGGVIEALFDFGDIDQEFAMLRRISEQTGLPVSFSLAQTLEARDQWRRGLELLAQANRDGVAMKAQVIGRPTGFLLGLDLSYNPFSLHPSYQAIQHLPPAQKAARMREPDMRAAILSENPSDPTYYLLKFLTWFEHIYPLGDPPRYDPSPDDSIAAMAARKGVSPQEVAYDLLCEGDGNAVLLLAIGNFAEGTLEPALEMLKDENTLLGLGDGGAHYGLICDAGHPTFMLTYWVRDRDGERLPLPAVIKGLARDPAFAVGLHDRGLIATGYKADINLIDFDRLHLHAPRPTLDLPAGGRRLVQPADGYVATLVGGQITYRNGKATGALPGRLVRGARAQPAAGVHRAQ